MQAAGSKATIYTKTAKTKVEKMIGSKLTLNNVLVTDAWRAYKTYAKEKGLEHYRIKSNDRKHVTKGLYHIQYVNGLYSRLKQWIERFKGVATKYLDNFLALFLFIDNHSNENTKHNIKDFLLSSFVYEMTDTYNSLRQSKFSV
nr:IS1595 family transposase [Bacillus sp. PS06]